MRKIFVVIAALIAFEALANTAIYSKVPYTEIDWVAYMDEVGSFLQGERNYTNMRGDTGPLVYPAGFVYLFSGLRWLTGGDIAQAQVIFAVLHVALVAVVLAIYARGHLTPTWAFVLLVLSRRIHSIFVLRLFNDCFAMFFAYLAVLAATYRRWTWSTVALSLGVSIKMNVLLLAPAGLLLLWRTRGLLEMLAHAMLAGVVQIALGAPFLAAAPAEYVSRAFDLGRVFLHQWTVNWQFLPEPVFVSRPLALALLALHVALLVLLAARWWPVLHNPTPRRTSHPGAASSVPLRRVVRPPTTVLLPSLEIALFLMLCNFIGVCAARSLHYQFYVWYYHMLPALLWALSLPTAARLLILGIVELVWNLFPPSPIASLALQAVHWGLCVMLLRCDPRSLAAGYRSVPTTAHSGKAKSQ